MRLSEISYPVYKLGSYMPSESEDGNVLYFYSKIEDADGEQSESYLVVDDKRVKGDTLGKRRLFLANKGVKLYKISMAVFFVGDLLKLAHSKTWFIDSLGKVFRYTKTKWVKLVHKKITKVIRQPGGGAVLELEGIPTRFKVLYAPTEAELWWQVLVDGFQYIFYGVTSVPGKDGKRMI